jgi:hypothetical protein
MISRKPINPNRIRRITGSFSWIDHRILHDGYLEFMSQEEMLLYFFLVLVGDKNGISFYSYDKICRLLKFNLEQFIKTRNLLLDKQLIAHKDGRFQVLQLPTLTYNIIFDNTKRTYTTKSLDEIFKEQSLT